MVRDLHRRLLILGGAAAVFHQELHHIVLLVAYGIILQHARGCIVDGMMKMLRICGFWGSGLRGLV